MHQVIDAQVSTDCGRCSQSGPWPPSTSPKRTSPALRAAMDEARARRLQPHYIELAFRAAFIRLGGRIAKREHGRYEIANVPAHIRASKHQPDRHQIRPRHLRPRARPARRPGPRRPARARAPTARRRHGRGHPVARRRPELRHRAGLLHPGGAAPARRRHRGGRRRHRCQRRPALRLRLRRQLRHRDPAGPAPYLDCVAAPDSPTVTAARQAAMAGRGRGQGDELDHHQPAPRVSRRGAAPPRRPNWPRPASLVTKRLEGERDRLLLGRRDRRRERAGRREAEGVRRKPQPQGR